MAYARYDRDCNWYIFQTSTALNEQPQGNSKEKGLLAVWHADHRELRPSYTYFEIREMLDSNDFSQFPGYSEADHELLRDCLGEFVKDVDVDKD